MNRLAARLTVAVLARVPALAGAPAAAALEG